MYINLMYDNRNIHSDNKWYILMNLVMFIIIENTFLVVINQMYLHWLNSKIISFQYMCINSIYNSGYIHRNNELYILMIFVMFIIIKNTINKIYLYIYIYIYMYITLTLCLFLIRYVHGKLEFLPNTYSQYLR